VNWRLSKIPSPVGWEPVGARDWLFRPSGSVGGGIILSCGRGSAPHRGHGDFFPQAAGKRVYYLVYSAPPGAAARRDARAHTAAQQKRGVTRMAREDTPPPTIVTTPSSEEPVYGQIARQLRDLIACGALPAGRRLPSVRALASDLGVNLNTVARAYRLLEEEGFVFVRGRAGVEVAPPGGAGTEGRRETRARLLRNLRDLLVRLRQTGMGPGELRELVAGEIEATLEPAGRPRERCRG